MYLSRNGVSEGDCGRCAASVASVKSFMKDNRHVTDAAAGGRHPSGGKESIGTVSDKVVPGVPLAVEELKKHTLQRQQQQRPTSVNSMYLSQCVLAK